MTAAERLTRLEENLMHLQRHVTEQDKVMLAMADNLARLRHEFSTSRERAPDGQSLEAPPNDESLPPADERPPHY